ncbi:LysR family transcriptional regulator [Streptomyces sp. 6N106]|uniref:LysR family transcriptional regulator n=1 Tax=Streptomyces sp. 6N106 TaxID=3457418 RepID=UPI003FD6AD8E
MAVELAQWRMFVAIADAGSLSRAAARLQTDQPALSRALRRLERVIGSELFRRSPRGVTLTALGADLLDQARHLVSAADELDALAIARGRTATAVLRAGALDFYPFTTALAEARATLAARRPPIAVELIHIPWLAHPAAVAKGDIDIGFTLTVDRHLPSPEVLCSTPLRVEQQVYALLPASHPLATTPSINPRDLSDDPLHLPRREDNPAIYDLILETLADHGVLAPSRAPTVDSLAAVVQDIAAGNGWTIVTSGPARHPVPGTVAQPLAVTLRHQVHLEAIWHKGANQTAVRALISRLRHSNKPKSRTTQPRKKENPGT